MAEPVSPLTGLLPTETDGTAELTLTERPFLAKVWLRGQVEDSGFLSACRGVLGGDLPLDPLRAIQAGELEAIRIAPDAWTVIGPAHAGAELAARFAAACQGLFAAAIDVSSARTTLHLAGREAPDLLATGCALDLDPAVFLPGHALQTRLGNVTALIVRREAAEPAYDLHVPRSQAESFLIWLRHAGAEFGLVS